MVTFAILLLISTILARGVERSTVRTNIRNDVSCPDDKLCTDVTISYICVEKASEILVYINGIELRYVNINCAQ